MQRFLIKCANCALLVLIVIGIPAITRVEFHGLQIASARTLQRFLLWAFALALALNAVAATILIKGRKERTLCCEWAAVFGVLLLAYWALIFGYIQFDWLKNFLLRLQRYF